MSSGGCPSREMLLAYRAGSLSQELAEAVSSHLTACPPVSRWSNSLDGVADTRPPHTRAVAASRPAVGVEAITLPRWAEYQLIEKLGEGGMGAVYEGRHIEINRLVAIKVLTTGRQEDRPPSPASAAR